MKKVVVKRKGNEIVSVSATVEPIDYDKLAEAIVKAQNARDESKKQAEKNSKVSVGTIFGMVLWGIVGFVFLILAIYSFFNTSIMLQERLATGLKRVLLVLTCTFFIMISLN